MAEGDLYSVLGVPHEATGPEIQAAYQRLIAQMDSGASPSGGRAALDEAHQTLGDPIRRLRYDAQASAPPPPRFQMPEMTFPGRRFRVPWPHVRRPQIPVLRRIDPILAAGIALVVIVALFVFLLPVFRGKSKPGAPAQSVADLVRSPTATRTTGTSAQGTAPTTTAGQSSTFVSGTPAAQGSPAAPGGAPPSRSGAPPPILGLSPPPLAPAASGTGLVPLPGAGATPPGGPPQGTEPPFLTATAVVDMLRAVIAAAAVRGGPSQAAVAPPATGAAPPIAPVSGVPGPSTASGSSPVSAAAGPPSASNAFPGSFQPPPANFGGVASTTVPTPTPAPNHISVPTSPLTRTGAPVGNAPRSGGAPANNPQVTTGGGTATAPNHIGAPATPTR